jgi:hypothetical protein
MDIRSPLATWPLVACVALVAPAAAARPQQPAAAAAQTPQ